MTVRDWYKRKERRLQLAANVAMTIFVVALCFSAPVGLSKHPLAFELGWTLIGILFISIIVSAFRFIRIECPRCAGRLRAAGSRRLVTAFSGPCPHCGLGFDEPMPDQFPGANQ
jgi:hypothetical protein